MHAYTPRLRRFQSDDRGAVAVIFGLIAVVFIAFGGITIDLSRTYSASSRAGAALDAALLAAGDARNRLNLNDAELQVVAERHFNANLAGAGVRTNEFSNFRMNISNGGSTFTAWADVSVPMHFAGLVSLNQIDFTATSTATFDQLDLELGLMLDMTGSMNRLPRSGGSSTKLEILKRAVSQDLLDTLLLNGDNDKIRVGYAPYSASVNAGPLATQVRDPRAPAGDSCIVERTTRVDEDDAPTGGFFRTEAEANATIRVDTGRTGYDYYACPNAEVLPLTKSKSTLVQTIDGYSASGRTAGHLGIAWAWYLVSPNWAPVWGPASTPKPYGTQDLVKAVVLFTDGAFNAAYDGNDTFAAAAGESYTRADQLCRNIKGEDVVVFAIGFDLNSTDPNDREAIDALRDCASVNPDSGGKYFFPTADENELRGAFQQIANSLTNLRLTQ